MIAIQSVGHHSQIIIYGRSMALSVTIEKQLEVVQTITEPIESGDISGLLTALKSAKTKTNEFLSELVVAEKATPAATQLTKSVDKADGRICLIYAIF